MPMLPLNFSARLARAAHRRLSSIAVRQALLRRGLGDAGRISTFSAREELEALHELATHLPPDASVLEIGSYLGASTCFIAAGLRGARHKIVCVDTWQNETMPEGTRDTFADFQKNVRRVHGNIEPVRKRSSDVTPVELGGPFDLVFLDGDHSYEQAKHDFELVEPLVTSGAVIAFHDSLFFEGVSRVIGEALASGKWQIGGTIRNLSWIARARFTHLS